MVLAMSLASCATVLSPASGSLYCFVPWPEVPWQLAHCFLKICSPVRSSARAEWQSTATRQEASRAVPRGRGRGSRWVSIGGLSVQGRGGGSLGEQVVARQGRCRGRRRLID